MSKTKIDGLPGWEIEPPSEKVIAEDKRRYVSEGLDLVEAEPEERKLQRQKNLFESMRWDTKKIDERLKSLKEKAESGDVKAKDLTPLDGEIKKLQKDFKRFKTLMDLRAIKDDSRAMSGLKSVIQMKPDFANLNEVIVMIEQFQAGTIGAESLLIELEKRGIFS